MKLAILFLSFVGIAFAQWHDCGQMPAKKPTQCCENLDKLIKEQSFEACKTECGRDHCCTGDCFGKALGFLKDGKFDKDTAVKALNTAFAGNQDWLDVATKSVNDCVSEAGSFKGPPGPACSNPENGKMTFCIKMKLFTNCPKPIKDAECDKVKTFIDCVENKKQ